MGQITTNRASTARATLGISALALALFLLAFASPAQAADKHLFDPVLSLSESADPDSEDPVPDPGTVHPEPRFQRPCGSATDRFGDIYVSSPKLKAGVVSASRIDVFSPQGEFLMRTEVAGSAACSLAVDSEGNVYSGGTEGEQVITLEPSAFPPSTGTTYSVVKSFDPSAALTCPSRALAVDPSNDHFYLSGACRALEYGSAAEGSLLIRELPIELKETSEEKAPRLSGIDVYGKTQDVYVVGLRATLFGGSPLPSRVFVYDGGDGHLECEISGAEAADDLEFGLGTPIAVDQSNGDVYVYSIKQTAVYQFAAPEEGECDFIGRLPQPPLLEGAVPFGDVAVDAPLVKGEVGYGSPNEGHVFVTSGIASANSHLFAYMPSGAAQPPAIVDQKATGITSTEAVLRAELNPGGLDTAYRFEYTTQADFEANEYANATSVPVPDAHMAKSGSFGTVTEAVTGLEAGIAYRFRLVASNCEDDESEPGACLTEGEGKPGEAGDDASFTTYASSPVASPCSNEALRTGPSASLPDCRAYELVTPVDTSGHTPKISILGVGFGEMSFDTTAVSPDGGSVVFGSNSGALSGIGGGGFLDTFQALRDQDLGWQSQFTGMSGAQAERPKPGGISSDHLYSFWNVEEGKGTLANPVTGYVQYLRTPPGAEHSPNCVPEAEPEGRFELIGCGSLGGEPQAAGRWISEGGGHVIFDTGGNSDPTQLEPCAPPTGISAIYDRTPGGPTRCVSLLPGDMTPSSSATYAGVSTDGTAVVFALDNTLYARLDNTETVEVATGATTFAGISRDGDWVFYLSDATGFDVPRGQVYACEVALGPCSGPGAQEPIQIGSGGESAVVNVSADGSGVYFVSPEKLDGEEGEEGEDNLYAWDGQSVNFIGVLDPRDVYDASEGKGLGRWIPEALTSRPRASTGPARDPSRTTPDGKVLVFESRADLTGTGYDNDDHTEIFRYDAAGEPGEQLTCISCNPTGETAQSDASLQSPQEGQLVSLSPSPVNAISHIANVSDDGEMVFFQSGDRLVPADLDGKLDVYEWEAQEQGGCDREEGCLSLISSGRSTEDDYLYAMTPDGSDVFFLSGDTLVAQDPDKTPSIYDARIDGGFPPPTPPAGECLGEACQPTAVAPDDPTPASSSFSGAGNVHEEGATKPRCPKGKRKVRSKGKVRCVKRQTKKKNRKNNRANDNRRAAR